MQSCWTGLPPIKRECIALGSLWKGCENHDVLIELVTKSNFYSQQNGRNFITNAEETKKFLGTNNAMAVNQLPNICMYWDCDHFIGNNGIQNIFTRGRYQDQDLHFVDNSKQDQAKEATGYTQSLITWTNHSKTAAPISLSKALVSKWPSSRDFLQWGYLKMKTFNSKARFAFCFLMTFSIAHYW